MSTKGRTEPFRADNRRRRQWLWFIGLALAGMSAMLVIAGLVRLFLRVFA